MTRIFLIVIMFAMIPIPSTASASVWYAQLLNEYFPDGVPVHDRKCSNYLPKDITKFDVTAGITDIGLGPAFAVKGSIKFIELPAPFYVLKEDYYVELQGFLISDGEVIWQQRGNPKKAWVSANGEVVEFILINSFSGTTDNTRLILIATGEPVLNKNSRETRFVLGIKIIDL